MSALIVALKLYLFALVSGNEPWGEQPIKQ